jgi:hypothetical protein
MNTNPRNRRTTSVVGLAILAAAAAASLNVAAGAARAGEEPASTGAKDYTLFLGTELALTTKDGTFPVWDISDGSWVVKAHGAVVTVGPKDGAAQIRMKTGMRLTEASATITNLKREPEFTPENDPYTKFTRATNRAASEYAQSQFASNFGAAQIARYDAETGETVDTNSMAIAGGAQAATNPSAAAAFGEAASWRNSASIAGGASPGMLVATGSNPDAEAYDALDVAFDVSSRRPLNRPYVVLIGTYHERGAPAGVVRDWIHARPLNVIDSSPQHVHFLAAGLPPGYELRSFELHLYNMGGEVATNVSPKRVEYTMDEAFDYYRSQYLSSHRNATLPAVPAMGRPPADLPGRLEQGLVAKTLYVRVAKDGTASGAYLDEACTRRDDDPYVSSLIRDIRFKPALDKGEPVEGVAKLMLDRLAM